ncbi:MAG: hypothetical protein UR90_C0037G0003 [Parcubacteria group bacterium GW2011_GWC1_35_8]|uniref:Uncharacterized protein n=2 Tax=Candidatus Nomuraibacteriota TaxID=1752729 RepID=A0A1F6YW65_9BACT|nr:MAG: hypothetical protein UR90_C0037G0003 [Parcubacteria group bacterium GW2011_GWC1_35_8]OGJ05902.1 MAG: hypothetical protein A2238_00665 [Candidatus Nomurabacteria bacterium RIFOXYA2_FULL_35_9]OGJ10598.1 MAG: hypothetical protein A2456_02575 [Candidatus Nomurabacteria bacterium RIFOXYC2_FULL_36_19]OGJ14100.1 MAG: hypothetical protein A2554_01110 [Candidatus Nomurabacteria bacterium RIFOXYD2_FULL_35_12]
MLPEYIIYFTVLVSLVAFFFYFRNIFRGQTKPNLVSWFIWMLAPFIGVFFQLKAGAGLASLPVFLAGAGSLLVIVFSLRNKNAYWELTKLDMICGVLSLTSLVFYIYTHNLSISILFAILSDGLAFIPTFIKSWKFPETETNSVYFADIFNNILGLLIIKNWSFTIYSFLVYLAVFNLIEIFILYRKKIFK